MNTENIKGYELIEKSKLTPEEQLLVIKEVLKKLESPLDEYHSMGLCFRLKREIKKFITIDIRYKELSEYLSIFNKNNANNFGNAILEYSESSNWWNTNDFYDFENRKLFLNWMINVIKYYIKTNK